MLVFALTPNILTPNIRYLDTVIRDEKGNASCRRELLRSLLVATDLASRRGDFALATADLGATDKPTKLLLEQEPTNLETQVLAIYADICAARISARDRPELASDSLRKTLRKLDQHVADSSEPRILELRTVALLRLGRPAEAAVIYHELQTIGYRSRMN